MTSKGLPQDLGGYQQIVKGPVKVGDIVRDMTFPFPQYAKVIEWHDSFVNLDVESLEGVIFYRKMPCPQQGGHEAGQGYPGYPRMWVDPDGKKDNRPIAETYDDGKPPLANLPWEGIKAVSRVQAYGHKKYKDYNNFRKGMEVSRNLSCAVRHIAAYMEGESLDPESKESHLAHAACRLLFVLQNEHDKVAIDDRYKK